MLDEMNLALLEAMQKRFHPKDMTMIGTAELNLALIRLARLGLWAEKVAIPEMKACIEDRHYYGAFPRHTKALESLLEEVS